MRHATPTKHALEESTKYAKNSAEHAAYNAYNGPKNSGDHAKHSRSDSYDGRKDQNCKKEEENRAQ